MSTKSITAKKQTKVNNFTLKESKIIPNTPFQAHKYNDTWIITCGKYRHSNTFDSYEQAEIYVNSIDWSLLSIAVTAIIEASLNNINNTK